MTKFSFKGRCCIVTGAGRGLGEAYARELASLKASVIVTDLGPSCEEVAASIVAAGGVATAVRGSVTSQSDVDTIARVAIEKYGRIDALCNNAGIGAEKPFMDCSMEEIRQVMEVHFFGTVLMTRAVWPHMKKAKFGRIVNITSTTIFGLEGWATYGSGKAAVMSLGRTLALEGSHDGIHVNMVAPTGLTPMLLENITDPKILASVQGAKPELCAPLVAYPLHEEAPYNGRTFFTGAGMVASILMGTTKGSVDVSLTVDKVAEMLATEDTHSNFKMQESTVDQTQSQLA